MYKIISALNGFIREEMIPNPFEFISDNQLIVMLFTYLIGGTILHIISFSMVGVFYRRGQAPVLGSLGYMFFYCINVQVLIKLNLWLQNINLIMYIYIIFVIVMFFILYKIKIVLRQNFI